MRVTERLLQVRDKLHAVTRQRCWTGADQQFSAVLGLRGVVASDGCRGLSSQPCGQ